MVGPEDSGTDNADFQSDVTDAIASTGGYSAAEADFQASCDEAFG